MTIEKFVNLVNSLTKVQNHFSILNRSDYFNLIDEVNQANVAKNKTLQRRRIAKYTVLSINGVEKLFQNKGDKMLTVLCVEDIYGVLDLAHQNTGHGGRHRIEHYIKDQYANIIREMIMCYLSLCPTCPKKFPKTKKGIVSKPILVNEMNEQAQMDLIDLQRQPDGNFKFILVYQDLLTKFVRLYPLKNKTGQEVAKILLKIFSETTAPKVLQTDNGKEFRNKYVEEVLKMFNDVKFVSVKFIFDLC
jgi:hypothetical protein